MGHNRHCDKWCERCAFTARCAVFADEQAEYESLPDDDANEAFWQDLETASEQAQASLQAASEDQGVDFDAFEDAQWEAREQDIHETVESHPLNVASMAYMTMVHEWLNGVDTLFHGKDRDPDRDDIVDIIGWYHMQIHVKVARALDGEERGVPEMIAHFPKDSDGSAKVALLGMDRSIAAWQRMKSHLPDREDEIREFMIALERLRRATERHFPAARSFVRPGFDETLNS